MGGREKWSQRKISLSTEKGKQKNIGSKKKQNYEKKKKEVNKGRQRLTRYNLTAHRLWCVKISRGRWGELSRGGKNREHIQKKQ